ncbi:hypothetical protein D3C80_1093090 [compost metagenome]
MVLGVHPGALAIGFSPATDVLLKVTLPKHATSGRSKEFIGLVITLAGVERGRPIALQNGLITPTFTAKAL